MRRGDEQAPRVRVWRGRGALRPDAMHVSAVRDGSGVIWHAERPAREDETPTRVRLAIRDGFFDLRREVLVDGKWTWTHEGVQLETSEVAGLVEALEDACR